MTDIHHLKGFHNELYTSLLEKRAVVALLVEYVFDHSPHDESHANIGSALNMLGREMQTLCERVDVARAGIFTLIKQ